MDINLLKRLVKVVEQSNITEFSVQEGDLKIKISKNSKQSVNTVISQPTNPVVQAVEPVVAQEPKAKEEEVNNNYHEIRSPIVGTFYRAPAPDADTYVQVGDIVSVGSVLCIVEAMKLMNEIESDADGKIVKILVENATPVEYNQPLFLIEKT
ncbi:Biotin carboxyl carrier protein of acetyl-CoA carboxylase [hydrothermal vent metagenome]|uniref:Biotin carboxyl carrier protein of acetyl-CoA carboxylase n=1 Tax=hydrothermal vent metagenome TaxID=652676 RepID=A0A3B1C8Z1_9ZZZZ